MAKKEKKLNSMRLLDTNKIPYEVLEYPTVTRDAQEVAELIGAPEFMVYKTLVVQPVSSKKTILVLLASDRQLDLKKMAVACGEKKVALVPHAEAERLTGLQVGGISALMLTQKNWDVYLDQSATELQNIIISAGKRGLQIRVGVTPLMILIRARIADVGRPTDD